MQNVTQAHRVDNSKFTPYSNGSKPLNQYFARSEREIKNSLTKIEDQFLGRINAPHWVKRVISAIEGELGHTEFSFVDRK